MRVWLARCLHWFWPNPLCGRLARLPRDLSEASALDVYARPQLGNRAPNVAASQWLSSSLRSWRPSMIAASQSREIVSKRDRASLFSDRLPIDAKAYRRTPPPLMRSLLASPQTWTFEILRSGRGGCPTTEAPPRLYSRRGRISWSAGWLLALTPTTARLAAKCQSFLDNVIAGLRRVRLSNDPINGVFSGSYLPHLSQPVR